MRGGFLVFNLLGVLFLFTLLGSFYRAIYSLIYAILA